MQAVSLILIKPLSLKWGLSFLCCEYMGASMECSRFSSQLPQKHTMDPPLFTPMFWFSFVLSKRDWMTAFHQESSCSTFNSILKGTVPPPKHTIKLIFYQSYQFWCDMVGDAEGIKTFKFDIWRQFLLMNPELSFQCFHWELLTDARPPATASVSVREGGTAHNKVLHFSV